MKNNKAKPKLKQSLPQTTIRALTDAEPNRKNLIIAFLFILVAMISQNFLPEKTMQRTPASTETSSLSLEALNEMMKR